MKSVASMRSKSSKSDSIKFDTFVTVDTELPSPSSERGGGRVVLSPKRKNTSSSLQKKDLFSPKRKKSILGGDTREKENCLVYKRPQAPQRPMPHMPPKINILSIEVENSDEEEIEATFSISKSLREPLYLSSARILNTPENSSGESFEFHEDLKSPMKSEDDVKLRMSITRSSGGIGTSIPREFFDSVDGNSQDKKETDRRISTPPVQSDEKKMDSATTVLTSNVIDALRIQTSDRGTSSCTVCGKSHNPRHSRVCVMCFRPMCKKCKKLNMVKLAKKSWVCEQCVSCVKVEFPIQNDFCSVCTLPKCRRSRSCALCKKHFCEVCKKEHMFKLGTAKWICHKHSMKEAFLDIKQNVSDT